VSGAALAHADVDEALDTEADRGAGAPLAGETGTGTPHSWAPEPFVDGGDFTMTAV
jgi:hypothetical protein